jgi:hypothetical protein
MKSVRNFKKGKNTRQKEKISNGMKHREFIKSMFFAVETLALGDNSNF